MKVFVLKLDNMIVNVFKSKEVAKQYINKHFYIYDEFYHTENYQEYKIEHKEDKSFKGYMSLMSYEVIE